MVDLQQLTQDQRWGLAYATKLANEAIAQGNIGKPENEKEPLVSESQYAERVFARVCDSYYAALIEAKKKTAIEKFESLAPEQQAALLEQLQVPDVLESE